MYTPEAMRICRTEADDCKIGMEENTMKKVLSIVLALALLAGFACFAVSAEENVPEEFGLFIAYGGDKAASNDWGYSYWGGAAPEGMTVTNGTIKLGETTTISLTFDTPTGHTWVVTPCLTADDLSGVTALEFDIVCKINGEEVAIDYTADSEGRLWWNENTGDYAATQCIRLAGTYNEWGQKYITVPDGVTSIEYSITLKSVNGVQAPAEEVPEAPIADGDTVKIYYPAGESYISATANDGGKKLLDATEDEAAVWTVAVDENGYYTFTCDGKYLTAGATGNALTLEEAASDYSLWTLEEAENGWYIKNVNASYYEKAQYVEYYSGFTTYGYNANYDSAYVYQFVQVEVEAPAEELVALLKFADADYWPATAGVCPTVIDGSGTYTLSIENITGTFGAGLDTVCMLYIEVEGGYEALKDYVLSNVIVTVDGEQIEVNQDFVWTYESVDGNYQPNGNYCIEIYNIFGYSGAGYGAAIDPAVFADESLSITFTLTAPSVEPEPDPEPNPGTGDAIFAVLSILAASGMGITAVVSKKK